MLNALLLILIFRYELVDSDCGFPSLPESTKINKFKQRYEEHSYVEYECDSKSKELIGGKTIHCVNGRWQGKTPKCAKESNVRLGSLMITDVETQKKVLRFFGSSVKDCWKPEFSWNISTSQKWTLQIRTNTRIDYFSLIVYGKDLITGYSKGNISKLEATIHKPHKHCRIDKLDLYENHLKTEISFECLAVSEEINLPFDISKATEHIKNIIFDVQLEGPPISVTFCNLKTYSLSDSCGSPEKPLHSFELIKQKSLTVFSCEEDFYLDPVDNQKVKCVSGKWDKPFPICTAKVYCRLPAFERIDHFMHIEYKDLNYINGTPFAETNSMAIYSCHSGNNTDFQLKGEVRRVCKHGFWSGSQPKCIPCRLIWIRINITIKRPQTQWKNLNLVIISMLASFVIGASFIGLIIYLVMKYVVKKKRRIEIPSVIVSEPNNYYERNMYEQYSYESIRLSEVDSDLERINSLYQTDINSEPNVPQRVY